ncbi:MAG: SH3 domain-containing protein [Leptospirales bacterium]|nr:SH3 domain-containing protein [Leptospirales bacterium]
MKLTLIPAAVALALTGFCTKTPSQDRMFVSAKAGLNLRTAPSATASVVRLVPMNAELKILSVDPSSTSTIGGQTAPWYHVEFQGSQGFVFGAFLSAEPSQEISAGLPVGGKYVCSGDSTSYILISSSTEAKLNKNECEGYQVVNITYSVQGDEVYFSLGMTNQAFNIKGNELVPRGQHENFSCGTCSESKPYKLIE